MKPARTFGASIVLLLLLVFAVAARQTPAATEPPRFALAVLYFAGEPPAFLKVPNGPSPGGAWYSRFRRVASWQQPPGSLPVRAVRITPTLAGDAVTIKVSAILGVTYHDQEKAVAEYVLHENEKATVNALIGFGVEPFEITVVRQAPAPTSAPSVINRTQSIEVVGIELDPMNQPCSMLTLRNLSNKNVGGLWISFLVGDRPRGRTYYMGEEGLALIGTGALFQRKVMPFEEAVQTPQGYVPRVAQSQSVLVATVLFEDGTFEGEPEFAAQMQGQLTGQKTQLIQIVALLRRALERVESAPLADLSGLKSEVSALKEAFDPTVKDHLLRDLEAIRASDRSNPQNETLSGSTPIALEATARLARCLKLIENPETGVNRPQPPGGNLNLFAEWLRCQTEPPPGPSTADCPNCGPVGPAGAIEARGFFQVSMHNIKKSLLDEIDQFQKTHKSPLDQQAVKTWLTATTDHYAQWLSRLLH